MNPRRSWARPMRPWLRLIDSQTRNKNCGQPTGSPRISSASSFCLPAAPATAHRFHYHFCPGVAHNCAVSVRIWCGGHGGGVYLYYREEKRLVEFQVAPSPRRGYFSAWLKNARGEIVLIAPTKLTDEDVQEIVPNLCLGLARLGFQKYKVRRENDNRILAAGGTKQLREAN